MTSKQFNTFYISLKNKLDTYETKSLLVISATTYLERVSYNIDQKYFKTVAFSLFGCTFRELTDSRNISSQGL